MMRKRIARFVIALTILFVTIFGALLIFPLQTKVSNFLAETDLDTELICGDMQNRVLGKMLITSSDKGKTLSVSVDGKSIKLDYIGSTIAEDVYESKSGQQLLFDGEVTQSGFFGDGGGYCS
jgi:hypothetical protein